MNKQVGGCLRTNELPWHACWEQMKSHFFQKREDFTALPCNYPIKGPRLYPCDPTKWRLRHTRWSWWWWDNLTPQTIWHLGQFDTDHAGRTIWHLGQFDTADNLTPSGKIGQFDTIMQNRTIWHCEKFSLTVWKKVVIGQQCISYDIFGPNSCQEIKYVFMCGPCRARIWYRLIIQDNFQSKR